MMKEMEAADRLLLVCTVVIVTCVIGTGYAAFFM
jgi:hypothetical protein